MSFAGESAAVRPTIRPYAHGAPAATGLWNRRVRLEHGAHESVYGVRQERGHRLRAEPRLRHGRLDLLAGPAAAVDAHDVDAPVGVGGVGDLAVLVGRRPV